MSLEKEIRKRLAFTLNLVGPIDRYIRPVYGLRQESVKFKVDLSPVTETDQGLELILRQKIERAFPQDSIVGEEFPEKVGTGGWTWYLDPIDGTESFIRGVPLFGTLVGVTYEEINTLGMVYFPALNELYYGAKGQGACVLEKNKKRPRPISVSQTKKLQDSLVTFTSFPQNKQIVRPFTDICHQAQKVRGWGDCYGHMLVASGRADIMLDPAMRVWDCAAIIPIIEEAGGHFVDFTGKTTIFGANALSTNKKLYPKIKKILST